jgi:hypothetical protein
MEQQIKNLHAAMRASSGAVARQSATKRDAFRGRSVVVVCCMSQVWTRGRMDVNTPDQITCGKAVENLWKTP